ncbi:MAG: ABC transporter ATP-binding protein [Deltaproteobacteria bacterium]|nr:ABC transporter ATP-binding protein [Deltaproteobacteria bacterium]MBW2639860.1 ABC transporter ATP-binding protein [Deltaproteobacteria bacterium]MBW2679303.1 ABC transporter ATP-binding protein [Deltaproteobacteria bacterium]
MGHNNLIINLTELSFSFSADKPVLDNLSFHLHRGDRIGLVGPNGSGKTTLFHIILGLLKPYSGTVELFGRQAKQEKDFREARKRIGLLFQDPDDQLFSPTVLEDVAFGPLNLGKSPEEARDIALKTLSRLDLSGFEDRITYKLSGGEKRLVSLATVLAMDPEVLLLDEPTNGLDEETEERITDILRKLELSYIFISHNFEFLSKTTDRIYAMSKGRISSDEAMAPHSHIHIHKSGRIPHKHKS